MPFDVARDFCTSGMLGGDAADVMVGLGHPMGSHFDLTLLGGHVTCLKLTPDGVVFWTDFENPEKMLIVAMQTIWMLAYFALENCPGRGFSAPIAWSDIEQVKEFIGSLGAPEYRTMPLELLVPRLRSDMAAFWNNFRPAGESR